jgi:hypothetical protein
MKLTKIGHGLTLMALLTQASEKVMRQVQPQDQQLG